MQLWCTPRTNAPTAMPIAFKVFEKCVYIKSTDIVELTRNAEKREANSKMQLVKYFFHTKDQK